MQTMFSIVKILINVFISIIVLTLIGGLFYSKLLQHLSVKHMFGNNPLCDFYSNVNVNFLPSNQKVVQLFQSISSTIEICWLNKPLWFQLDQVNLYLSKHCNFSNCKIILDKKNMKRMKALIFSGQEKLDHKPITFIHGRPPNQIWVFFRMEPPVHRYTDWYRHPQWHNTMNWTWGYRRDSDIYFPYQSLKRKADEQDHRDYRKVFRLKTKAVVWVVSHCRTQSQRDKYVHGLKKAGLSIDILGRCSESKKHESVDYIANILKSYKFVLAFENSFCKDYITEKFFQHFDLDIIPIVRGSFNYSEHFEKLTYIDISDFQSIKDAANYINVVGTNESLYIEYLKRKNKYSKTTLLHEMSKSACTLCEKLNNVNRYKKMYKNIESYIHNNTCYPPADIK